jgi:hypothetical protein
VWSVYNFPCKRSFCHNCLRVLVFVLAAGMFFSMETAFAAVTVSTAATANMNCSGGNCAPTAKNAVLNVNDLTALLANGNVQLSTGTGSLAQQVKDIVISGAFNWASANSLTLIAYDSITITEPVTVNGNGAVSLLTNDGGTSGNVSFGPKGSLTFINTSNSLMINGNAYTLVDSVAALASSIAASPSGNFALANSYNAAADGGYSNSPIATSLTGKVEGLGNTISRLSLVYKSSHGKRRGAYLALFAAVDTSGVVENLQLTKMALKNSAHSNSGVGGLVVNNAGYLFGDHVSGSIQSRGSAAGLVLYNLSTGSIVSSSATVRIDGQGGGGGLVATNDGSISLSSADGSGRGMAAGLVAQNEGLISQSYATGEATVGGLVLYNEANGTNYGTIKDSYSTVAIAGGASGGFVGEATLTGTTIETSYSTGAVLAGDGGFACQAGPSNVSNDYWDTTTSGTAYAECSDENTSGITGLTTAQFQSGLPSGFDPKIWAESPKINGGLPFLVNNPPPK